MGRSGPVVLASVVAFLAESPGQAPEGAGQLAPIRSASVSTSEALPPPAIARMSNSGVQEDDGNHAIDVFELTRSVPEGGQITISGRNMDPHTTLKRDLLKQRLEALINALAEREAELNKNITIEDDPIRERSQFQLQMIRNATRNLTATHEDLLKGVRLDIDELQATVLPGAGLRPPAEYTSLYPLSSHQADLVRPKEGGVGVWNLSFKAAMPPGKYTVFLRPMHVAVTGPARFFPSVAIAITVERNPPGPPGRNVRPLRSATDTHRGINSPRSVD
jgi:hypothetical protein